MLMVYLQATIVVRNGQVLLQKAGVCIGSCVVPALSSIFLRKVGAKANKFLQGSMSHIYRYVDDYSVVRGSEPLLNTSGILKARVSSSPVSIAKPPTAVPLLQTVAEWFCFLHLLQSCPYKERQHNHSGTGKKASGRSKCLLIG